MAEIARIVSLLPLDGSARVPQSAAMEVLLFILLIALAILASLLGADIWDGRDWQVLFDNTTWRWR